MWKALTGFAAALCLVFPTATGCGGRAIGNGEPAPDAAPWVTDAWVPVADAWVPVADAWVPPPDAAPSCEGSPVRGMWYGSFNGRVYSNLTGEVDVSGTMQIEIYCEETLLVHGTMEGSEQSGVPFEAVVDGEYDEDTGVVRATWEGTVYTMAASGSLQGVWGNQPTEHIRGSWQGTAPSVQGTGNGQWTVGR